MTRWIKHWQGLPPPNRIGSALCLAALIACIIALATQIGALVADFQQVVSRD